MDFVQHLDKFFITASRYTNCGGELEVGRSGSKLPVFYLLIALIGLTMVIIFLCIREDLDSRTSYGFYDGAFIGYSLPYIGSLLFSLGIFLLSLTYCRGSKGSIVKLTMLIGFIIEVIGSIGLVLTYYQWYVMWDWPWVIDYDLLQNLVIMGLVFFSAGIALLLYALTITKLDLDAMGES